MKRNISALDKNIRLLIIVVIAILGLYNEFSVTVASVLGAISNHNDWFFTNIYAFGY